MVFFQETPFFERKYTPRIFLKTCRLFLGMAQANQSPTPNACLKTDKWDRSILNYVLHKLKLQKMCLLITQDMNKKGNFFVQCRSEYRTLTSKYRTN
jgi:hypothetical protein